MSTKKSTRARREPTSTEVAQDVDTTLVTRSKALVFISHDSRDSEFAEAFGNLLSDVSGGTLKSFRSSDKKGNTGIEFGTEWYAAIMSQLADATDVVALLTQNSIDRPWILYEAGVAKGKLETNVLGVALGVPLEKVSSGPFGQFQNCGDDEDSLTKLVMQLLRRNPDASPREEAVRRQVQAFLDNTKKLRDRKGAVPAPQPHDETTVAKLFEEVKAMVRELPERVDDRVRSATKRGSSKRFRRFHPMMFEELLIHPKLFDTEIGRGTAWLVVISMLKDDFPWIYEAGMEVYRALRSGSEADLAVAREALLALVKTTMHGPIFHEMLRPDDEEWFFLARHLPELLERFLHRDASRSSSRPRLNPQLKNAPASSRARDG